MKIIVGFVNNDSAVIKLRPNFGIADIMEAIRTNSSVNLNFMSINGVIINLDKVTYIREYNEIARPLFTIKEEEENENE